MGYDDESDIFDSATDTAPQQPQGGERQPQLPAVREDVSHEPPDAQTDFMVSQAISNMQRQPVGRDARPPARYQPRFEAEPPQQQQPQAPQMSPDVQGILAELRAERQSRQALERQLHEQRNPRQPETPFNERIFQDPENSINGRVREHLDPLVNDVQTRFVDMDFRLARAEHGKETFDAAYRTWFSMVGDPQRPDPHTYWTVMNSSSPGEALVAWYENRPENMEARIRRQIMEEMGIEVEAPPPPRANGKGNGQHENRAPNGQFVSPRHEVRLPTPTSRMGHSSKSSQFQAEDGSEEAIFDFGRATPNRR